MKIRGFAWKYGDNIDTDLIIPGKYLDIGDVRELARHAMEGLDPDFVSKFRPGDVIVAGRNFGCGSSRENAADVLKELGVGAVVAESFARIFFRNAINIGLPVLECEGCGKIEGGHEIELDMRSAMVFNHTSGSVYRAGSLPDFILDIVEAGGLVEYKKKSRR